MALISAADAAAARDALSVFRGHTCTITPRTAGAADGENSVTYTAGSPVTGIPCKYRPEDRVVIQATGVTLVSVPTVAVAHDLSVTLPASLSNVQDADGVVLFVGPANIDYVVSPAGLGRILKKKLVLRGADVR